MREQEIKGEMKKERKESERRWEMRVQEIKGGKKKERREIEGRKK